MIVFLNVGDKYHDAPLTKNISLVLSVCVGERSNQNAGDLDNFITGICDGLQAAHPSTPINAPWSESQHEKIHPRVTLAIQDDAEVMSIDAKKTFGDSLWYRVEIKGE